MSNTRHPRPALCVLSLIPSVPCVACCTGSCLATAGYEAEVQQLRVEESWKYVEETNMHRFAEWYRERREGRLPRFHHRGHSVVRLPLQAAKPHNLNTSFASVSALLRHDKSCFGRFSSACMWCTCHYVSNSGRCANLVRARVSGVMNCSAHSGINGTVGGGMHVLGNDRANH